MAGAKRPTLPGIVGLPRPRTRSAERSLGWAVLAAACLLAPPRATALIAPPPNDNFANAQVLTGRTASASGTNVDATNEPGEPEHAGQLAGVSVWYSWTAPESGTVVINLCASNFDTLLGVYTGTSVSALQRVASNDDGDACPGAQSRVRFKVGAGITYNIAVDGSDEETGQIRLRLTETPVDTTPPEVQIVSPTLALTVNRVVAVVLRCTSPDRSTCLGRLALETIAGRSLGSKSFRIRAGKRLSARVRISGNGYRAVVGRTTSVRAVAAAHDQDGNKTTTTRVLILKGGLPDLVIAGFLPDKKPGQRCVGFGPVDVRWSVVIRNRGPGAAPSSFGVRTGRRVTRLRLSGRLLPGKTAVLASTIGGGTRVVVDPNDRVEENAEQNNARTAPERTLTCLP